MSDLASPPPLNPESHALFVDFDGTLVDFAPTPDAIALRPGTVDRLGAISNRLDGALGIITGRRIVDVDSFLAPLQLPASGLHGLETRLAGAEITASPPSPQIATARDRLSTEIRPDDRLRFEDKGGALVLHFREHPDEAERAGILARKAAEGLADLSVVDGHAIAEIRMRGVDKAKALQRLLASPPFDGRLPVYVGDDTTDEDGFRAAAESGGFGIKVGEGQTAAAFRLGDVFAVHQWLATIA